jgi:NADH-quinone oxidoreductase subunit L
MAKSGSLLPLILFLPLLGAIVNGLVGKRLPKKVVGAIGISTVAIAFGLVVASWLNLRELVGQDPDARLVSPMWTWIDSGIIKIQFSLTLDQLSALMALVVTGVGSLIHLFSVGYMEDDESYHRYFAYLNLFMFSMLSLILGSNALMMFLGWEGVGLCSYLLIGFWFDDDLKAQAGQKAFIVNRIGDFGFLIGLFMLMFYTSGNTDFAYMRELFSNEAILGGTAPLRDAFTITLICLLFFVGATGKSAQIPLYIWLPDAMAGPTPVSALIHAATMVTAGVYMLTRLNFLYALSPLAMAIIATVGAATALFAATMGILQRDIKKVLAYSTVSQLGFMFLGAGVGAFSAAIFHVMTHAFFKACLFLGSGAIIHALHHEQDIFRMGNLRKKLPIVHWTFLIATLAIAGVPPLAGFMSKEAILHGSAGLIFTSDAAVLAPWGLGAYAGGYHAWFQVLTWMGLAAAFCTAFYMFRLYFITFWGEFRGSHHAWDEIHPPGVSMHIPLIVLGVLSAVGGLLDPKTWLTPLLDRPLAWFTEDHSGFLAHSLMPISITVASAGIALAWFLYMGPGRELPAKLQAAATGLYDLVFNKYYVDEIYDVLVVKPLQVSSRVLFRVFDRVAIDTIGVRGAPWLIMAVGRMARFVQNGDVQRYAAVMVLGLAALIYML